MSVRVTRVSPSELVQLKKSRKIYRRSVHSPTSFDYERVIYGKKIENEILHHSDRSRFNSISVSDLTGAQPKLSLSEVSNKKIRHDQHHCTIDHHKTKKRQEKCQTKSFVIGFLLLSLLIAVVVAIVVLIILLTTRNNRLNTRTAILRWNTTGITVAGITGISGTGSNTLNQPYDAIVDYAYNIYVADYGNNRVQKFAMGSSIGETVAGDPNGTNGTLPNRLSGPGGVQIDMNGDLYVADRENHRIQIWRRNAVNGSTIAGNTLGIPGSTNASCRQPTNLILDLDQNQFYVLDTYNHRIMRYVLGASSGTVVAGGFARGLNRTQLAAPIAGYLDRVSQSLVIVNLDSHSIVRWVLGESNWTLVLGSDTGISGNASNLFDNPRDITVDPMGNRYVADRDNQRIQFFSEEQSSGTTIAGITGLLGNQSNLFFTPRSIKLDNQLNMYVTDAGNHRIQKFLRY